MTDRPPVFDERLRPGAFFDLKGFAHPALFAADLPVWTALDRLADYLSSHLAAHPGNHIEGTVAAGAYLVGDGIHIGRGSVVEPGACVRGPCIIGRDSEVRHGAYVRGLTLIGDGCVVGHATEVKGSVFLDGAKAGHFAYVGDSVLGRDVNLGAGTKLANLRLDGRAVRVRLDESWIDTGRRKLGAILGDRTETGCNSVTNPGSLLAPGALVRPCATVSGYLAARPRSGRSQAVI